MFDDSAEPYCPEPPEPFEDTPDDDDRAFERARDTGDTGDWYPEWSPEWVTSQLNERPSFGGLTLEAIEPIL